MAPLRKDKHSQNGTGKSWKSWLLSVPFWLALAAKISYNRKKEKKRVDEMMASLAIGDSVLTSSGFYGVIIDMTDDTVIVEFGSNKNCRSCSGLCSSKYMVSAVVPLLKLPIHMVLA